MQLEDILKIVAAIAISFGGGAAIIIGLSNWLGNLWARRILQTENAKFQAELEGIRHEFGLVKSSYEHHLNLILDYYSTFYRHYRLCQDTARADTKRTPDGTVLYTKEKFLDALDHFIAIWNNQEGKIRLLLPNKLLSLHNDAIERFNRFKRAVDAFDSNNESSREEKMDAFRGVEEVKTQMEIGLREFLRTEKLLK